MNLFGVSSCSTNTIPTTTGFGYNNSVTDNINRGMLFKSDTFINSFKIPDNIPDTKLRVPSVVSYTPLFTTNSINVNNTASPINNYKVKSDYKFYGIFGSTTSSLLTEIHINMPPLLFVK